MQRYNMLIDSRFCKVTVDASSVSYTILEDGILKTEILDLQQLLQSSVHDKDGKCKLTIYYSKFDVINKDNVIITKHSLKFEGLSADCLAVKHAMDKLIQESPRPKKLLVFFNRVSGCGIGIKAYYTIIEPIFHFCGIQVNAIETEDEFRVGKVLKEFDLSSVDGVVCVGGDGFLNQIATALLARSSREAGISVDDSDAPVPPSKLPIGIIPCGSANAVGRRLNGTADIESATLNIVLGMKTKADVVVLRNHGKFIRYCCLVILYGLLSDIQLPVEKTRWWAGRARYSFFLPLILWKWRTYDVQVHFHPVNGDNVNFSNASEKGVKADSREPDTGCENWRVFKGAISDLSLAPWQHRNFYKNYLKMRYQSPSVSSGKLRLTVCTKSGLREMLESYRNSTAMGSDGDSLGNVQQYDIDGFRMTKGDETDQSPVVINVDGEIILLEDGLSLDVRVFPEVLELFCINEAMVTAAFDHSE